MTPKVILKFTRRGGRPIWVFLDHLVGWEADDASPVTVIHLSNGEHLVVTETCAQIEKHCAEMGRGGF